MVAALHKASFSADQVTEVSMKMYEVHHLLTLQFFLAELANFLCSDLSSEVLRFHLIKFKVRCATTQQKNSYLYKYTS